MASTHCITHPHATREHTGTDDTKPVLAVRKLKVRTGHYDYARQDYRAPEPVPWIYIKGYWLQQAGFLIGTPVQVQISKGRLVITIEDRD